MLTKRDVSHPGRTYQPVRLLMLKASALQEYGVCHKGKRRKESSDGDGERAYIHTYMMTWCQAVNSLSRKSSYRRKSQVSTTSKLQNPKPKTVAKVKIFSSFRSRRHAPVVLSMPYNNWKTQTALLHVYR